MRAALTVVVTNVQPLQHRQFQQAVDAADAVAGEVERGELGKPVNGLV
tara:strand:+ start:381 stop:524 length:144 start_codon:yes stop_codon:yes gene_type:complete